MQPFISQPGFVQVSRRCAVRRNDPPNHLLWDVLYDGKELGRVTVHGGQVNHAYGKMPPGITPHLVKTALQLAGQL